MAGVLCLAQRGGDHLLTALNVRFIARLGDSPAAALVPAYHSELVESGHAQNDKAPKTSMESWGVEALMGDECVGYMSVFPALSEGYLWISDAFVVKEHRRKGIHDAMFRCVVDQAKKEGVNQVQSGVHVSNKASQRSCEKQGRRVLGYIYEFVIDGEKEGVDG